MTDLETWFLDFGSDHIFRLYDKNAIPFMSKVRINNLIELPNNEVLIEYFEVDNKEDFNSKREKSILYYKKLSEVKLEYCPCDNQFYSDTTDSAMPEKRRCE